MVYISTALTIDFYTAKLCPAVPDWYRETFRHCLDCRLSLWVWGAPILVIACVIPAYNEADFITDVIHRIPDLVRHVIVVNDASTDCTRDEVLGLNSERVILIDHAVNQGVGGAMISGYKHALELKADIVVKIDGDGQINPKNIKSLVTPIERGEADYTKGVRFRDRAVLEKMPRMRLFGNIGLSFLTKIASGYWNIFDPTNGFTAIHRMALESLELENLDKGFFFETDMLINLNGVGAVVQDIRMETHYGNEQSHLSPLKMCFTFPPRLIRAFVKRILWQYFIKDFTALSVFLVCGIGLFSFGFCFGLYKWISNLIAGVATPAGTVMLAALPVILGFQLLLQTVVLDVQNVPKIPLHSGNRR